MKTALEIITGARAILAGESAWCQGHFARKADGTLALAAVDSSAVSWSLDGALQKAADGENTPEYTKAYNTVRAAMTSMGFGAFLRQFNDSHTHAEVLAVLDQAVKFAA